MIRRPPRSTLSSSSAASDVYKRQEQVAAHLGAPFRVVEVDPSAGRSVAESRRQDGKAVVGVVTGGSPILVLMDGTQLFSVRTAEGALGHVAQAAPAGGGRPRRTRWSRSRSS